MKKYASELEFISKIKRDGLGTQNVIQEEIDLMMPTKHSKGDVFKINCLSISNETYIASGFNSYVVKLKK